MLYPNIGQEIKMYADMLELVEEDWGVNGVNYENNIANSNNKIDITAIKADRLLKSGDGDVIREIETHITYLKTLQSEIFREFKKLPYYEKQVIYYYYLDGKRWMWIARNINYSIMQCQRFRDKGVDYLCTYFEGLTNDLCKQV